MRTLVKKIINTQLAIMYYPNGKEMDQMVPNEMACHCIPLKKLLFGAHAFNFNCFLDDFNCIFMQMRCLSVLLTAFVDTAMFVLELRFFWDRLS